MVFDLKSTLSDITIATPVAFWFPLSWDIFCSLFQLMCALKDEGESIVGGMYLDLFLEKKKKRIHLGTPCADWKI